MATEQTRPVFERRTCPHCLQPYNCYVDSEAICCGKSPCWQLSYWGDEEWRGAARMAKVRLDLGIEASSLDTHALRRTIRSVS